MKNLLSIFILLINFLFFTGCSKDNNPSSSEEAGYNGIWNGTTSQGKQISFRVADNGIDSLSITYRHNSIDARRDTCFGPVNLSGSEFSVTISCSGPEMQIIMSGSFTSASQSSGRIILTYMHIPPVPPAMLSDTISWTAAKGGNNNQNNLSGAWIGYSSSSLVPINALSFEIVHTGNNFSGSFSSTSGSEGTISGSVGGNNITFSMIQTTQSCPGNFSGSGTLNGDTINFTFTGNDCLGTHTNGRGKVWRSNSAETGQTFLSWTNEEDPSYSCTLVRVNGQTGAVTEIGGSGYYVSMAYAPNGLLYGLSTELVIIDPSTGSTVKIGNFSHQGRENILMIGSAFSDDGTLYAKDLKDSVYSVNLTNAQLTFLDTLGEMIYDLEFAPDGTLYGAFGYLYTIDKSDFTCSAKGPTGFILGPLTFNSQGGMNAIDVYYATTKIYSINLSNGQATPIVTAGCNGLMSFVAEKQTSLTTKKLFREAALKYGLAPAHRTEEFLKYSELLKKYNQKKLNLIKLRRN